MTDEIRRLRMEHPNLGKRKIHPLLLRFCRWRGLRCPAVITIGRLISDAGGLRAVPLRLDNRGRRKRPRPPKPRKPKGFSARRPGEVLAVDTVILGVRAGEVMASHRSGDFGLLGAARLFDSEGYHRICESERG